MKYDRQKMLKPMYDVKFNGKSITSEFKRNITEISIEESDYEADLVRITVMDKDFKFSNKVRLLQNQKAEVTLGYSGQMIVKVKGKVTTIEGDFSDDNMPTLIIGIVDDTNKMTEKKKTRKWTKKRASDIVKQIAKEYGLKTAVPTTSTIYDEYSQDEETDAELLQKLADDEGLVFYIISKENKLYFGECIKNPKSIGTLAYGIKDKDIIAFQPQLNTKDSPNLVQVKAGEVSSSTAKTYVTTVKAKVASNSKQSTKQSTKGKAKTSTRSSRR